MVKKLYYRSDFDFILDIRSENGVTLGFPNFDWEAYVYTSKTYKYKAACLGGSCINCYDDNGKIHIIVNNHALPAGVVRIEFVSFLPNKIYSDGTQRVVQIINTDIELINDTADISDCGSVEMVAHYAVLTSYDIAKANGYDGTVNEYNEALTRLPLIESDITDLKETVDDVFSDHETRIEMTEDDITRLNNKIDNISGGASSGLSSEKNAQIAAEVIGGKLFIHNYKCYRDYYPIIFRFTSKRNRLINENRNVKHRGPIKKGWHPMVNLGFAKVDNDGFVMFNTDITTLVGNFSYKARYAINAYAVGTCDCYVRWGREKICLYTEDDNITSQDGTTFYKPLCRKFKFAIAFANSDFFNKPSAERFESVVSNLAFFSIVFDEKSENFILTK